MNTTVLLVDSHILIRDLLADLISRTPGFEVIAQTDTGDTGLALAIQHQPNIVILDVDIPGLTCFEAAQTIKTRCTKSKILLLCESILDQHIEQALSLKVAGFMAKCDSPDTIINAISAISQDKTVYSSQIQSRFARQPRSMNATRLMYSRASLLTPREKQVLHYIANGIPQKEIANTMRLSTKTVHCHTANIMTKLDIHDRVGLTRYAIREGMVEA